MSVNWEEARRKYVFGNCSYQDIADEFKVSRRSVERQASKGQWVKAKEEHVGEVTEECRKKSIKLGAEFIEGLNEDAWDLEGKIRLVVKKDDKCVLSPRDIYHLTASLLNMLSYNEKLEHAADDGTKKLRVEFVGGEWLDGSESDAAETESETDAVSE